MDEKISLTAIETYSERFAATIANDFYSINENITGAQILTLTEIKQVNLFVVRQLLTQWQTEVQRFKSPYFDYSATEVSTSLKAFQNSLSNHISISKENFLPLLQKAIAQTLYLLLDPYDFYSETLDTHGKSFLNVSDLRDHVKYVKINKAPLEKLLEKLTEKKVSSISGNEAFSLLDSILEEVNFTPEEVEGYVLTFSKVVPLQIENLLERKVQKPVINVTNELKKNVLPKVESIQTSLPLIKEPIVNPSNGSQKVSRIKEKLTINQKFMFTKMLFHGDFEIFTQAIDRLDTFDSLQQAKSYLERTYPEWDSETEEYAEFISLVERRFI